MSPFASGVYRLKSTGTEALPSSRVPRRLQDIVDNAQTIFAYTAGMDLAAFEENRLVYDAVERCIERITEAARNSATWRCT